MPHYMKTPKHKRRGADQDIFYEAAALYRLTKVQIHNSCFKLCIKLLKSLTFFMVSPLGAINLLQFVDFPPQLSQ